MQLSKEEMFDFILQNNVTVTPDNTLWTRYDENHKEIEKVRLHYRVSINGSGMSGFDLEEAIQYYVDNLLKP